MSADFREAIRGLIHDLTAGKYEEIVASGRGGRLTANELQMAIAEYGRRLVDLPDEAWALVDTYELSGVPGAITADVPLWTVEEGRSDLTLSVTLNRVDGRIRLDIDNLHVP